MSAPNIKKSKDDANREVSDTDLAKEAKSIMEKLLGDVSKTSATKQIIIGTTSGWCVFSYLNFFLINTRNWKKFIKHKKLTFYYFLFYI